MPALRRACFAAELTARPTLEEPVFLVEIGCPKDALSGVYNCLHLRRGCVFEENQREGTPLVQVKAHLPVAEPWPGRGSAVAPRNPSASWPPYGRPRVDKPSRSASSTIGRSSRATWAHEPTAHHRGNCLEKGSAMEALVLNIRKRKALKLQMPLLSDYLDKLCTVANGVFVLLGASPKDLLLGMW